MQYYGTKLSENISRREPEGYLLCLNVPVARTGEQEYLPEELGEPLVTAGGGNITRGEVSRNKRSPQCGAAPIEAAELPTISVFRPEEEVFSPETMASFEGMPVTNDHPPDGVTIENIRALQKGHAHNVRRGSGDESDLLLADLIITDEGLIEAILDGKREISCGYTYELCEENGQYCQRKIRGNHVAVVDAGRAGPRVSIKDQKPERRKTIMKKSLLKKLSKMARDGDPEAVEALAEVVAEIADPADAPAVAVAVAQPEAAPAEAVEEIAEAVEAVEEEAAAPAGDSDGLAAIIERLDRLITLLTPAAADNAPSVDEDPDGITAEAVEEIVEEVVENGIESGEAPAETAETVAEIVEEVISPESTVLEPEEDDECGTEPESTADAIRAAVMAVRPVLRQMSRQERRKACADIAARLKVRPVNYGALAASAQRIEPEVNPADLGKRIMAARNANFS